MDVYVGCFSLNFGRQWNTNNGRIRSPWHRRDLTSRTSDAWDGTLRSTSSVVFFESTRSEKAVESSEEEEDSPASLGSVPFL